MLFLNGAEINNLISMSDVIDVIEKYYLNDGEKNSVTPERLFINDQENTALLMPSFYEDYYGAKLIGIAPGNVKINEPTLRGVFLLNNRQTMESLGLFDARTITALRTGAVGGLSMKYLSNKHAKRVGIIGTGDQGWSHLQAACAVRPIEEVYVYNRSRGRLEAFMEKAKKHFPHLKISAPGIEELVDQSDIIITATTSRDSVLPEKEDFNMTGKHIVAPGAFKPFMQEVPDFIIREADQIFVDTHAAFLESGEMIKAKKMGRDESNVLTVKELVKLGDKAYRNNQLTMFKSVGQAIYDILTAKLIYEKSKVAM